MTIQLLRTLVATACLIQSVDVFAAEQPNSPSSERPRVGLVLGGGGARGAAHIGVLRELERLQVPIDAIAGTSMGAVVGGLYAAGSSPDELEELIASLDWADAFQDAPRREDLNFRRKQDDAAFPMGLELGVRDGALQIPLGLIQGQKLALILRNYTARVAHIQDFDALPIPFRAVASDIATGDAYVMDKGDLALAMRASMAAPGVFAPAVVDNRTLVDGGLVGNVPVDVMQRMGVDIIIAVDVEFPLYEPDQINSAVDISAQVLTILIRKETRRQLEALDEKDILIRPELGQFGSAEFANIANAVEPGAVAVQQNAERLAELRLDDEAYRFYQERRRRATLNADTVEFIRVYDDGRLSEQVLKSRLRTQIGDPLDPTALADDAARLYGLSLYEQVDYKVVKEEDKAGVEFTTQSKTWGPNFLQFGLLLQDDFDGQTSFNLSSRLTRGAINYLGAEWRTDLQLGTEPYLFSEFYQPLSADSRFFVAPQILLEQDNFNVFADANNVARYRVSNGRLAVDVGYELGLWGEVRLGAFRGTGHASRKTGAADLPNIDFETGGYFTSFNIDTLDNAVIPLQGTRLGVQWTLSRPGFGADNNFDSIESEYNGNWTSGRHTLSAGFTFNTTVDADGLVQNFFPLGGLLNLSGLQRGEISGPHAGVVRVLYYRRMGDMSGLFNMPLYLGGSVEAGNVWQSREDIGFGSAILNGSLFAAIDTFFGPLYLAVGLGEGGTSTFYLNLGQTR